MVSLLSFAYTHKGLAVIIVCIALSTFYKISAKIRLNIYNPLK